MVNLTYYNYKMIKGQVYKLLNKNFQEFLFGFDQSKLDVSILSGIFAIISGRINLNDVNLRPEKINDILANLHIPIGLKAGMIKRLSVKYSILSWSSPFEITIDDLQLVLGPSMTGISNDDSYIYDDNPGAPYDQSNCFNIFSHNIKVSQRSIFNIIVVPMESPNATTEDETFLCEILSNMTLIINKLHIRYEDDYFAGRLPFSFGILCSSLTTYIVDNEWNFSSIESFKFTRVIPKDPKKLRIREVNIKDARIYWKSPAEMIIPISLYESTKNAENQIFEAISVEEMRNMMSQSFAEDNLIEQFSIYLSITRNNRETALEEANHGIRFKTKIDILLTKIKVNITTRILENIAMLREYASNFLIVQNLKTYRPKYRPITSPEQIKKSEQLIGIVASRRKRLLIVRDWFFFVVWANRIKTLVRKFTAELYKNTIKPKSKEFQSLYSRLIKKATISDHMKGSMNFSIDEYMAELGSKIEKEETWFKSLKMSMMKLWSNTKVGLRIQELSINFSLSNDGDIIVNGSKKPMFELLLTVLL